MPQTRPGARYAVLGPDTFTEEALDQYLSTQNRQGQKIYCQSIQEAFQSLENGKANFAIVPESNSFAGPVEQMRQCWDAEKHQIVAATQIDIHLCLIGLEDSSIKKIKVLASKKEAIAQCSHYLQANIAQFDEHHTNSTAAAVDYILSQNEPFIAALASKNALKPGTKILTEKIENQSSRTNFIIFKMV